MKKNLKYYLLVSAVCFGHIYTYADTDNLTPQQHYEQLQYQLSTGWNTWDTRSALTHVLLPYGAAIDLHVVDGKRDSQKLFYHREWFVACRTAYL